MSALQRVFGVLGLVVSFGVMGTAQAVVIKVDPGIVGSMPADIVMPFTDLNGTTFDGSSLTLDFEFDLMKHVEVGVDGLVIYTATLELAHDGDLLTSGEFPSFPTGFLSDENASPIITATNNTGKGNANLQQVLPNSFSYLLEFYSTDAASESSDPPSELAFDGMFHHDVHFDLDLPTSGDVVTGGVLHLYFQPLVDSGGDPLGSGDFLIGEWEQEQEPDPMPVPLDIKPGSDPNSVNLKSKGVLPVAVLSTDDFNVSDINVSTLLIGDPELTDGNGTAVSPLLYAIGDVSDDGLLDLALKFSIADLVSYGALGPDSMEGLLTGELLDGTPFEGFDSIRIVPPKGSNGNNGNVLLAGAIPEPSSILLFAFGLVGAGFQWRRSK